MNNRILTKIVTLCLCMSVLVSAEKSKDQLIKGNKALADTREQMINNNSQEKMKLEGITNDLKVVDARAKKVADKKEAAYKKIVASEIKEAAYRSAKKAALQKDVAFKNTKKAAREKVVAYKKAKKDATYRNAKKAAFQKEVAFKKS